MIYGEKGMLEDNPSLTHFLGTQNIYTYLCKRTSLFSTVFAEMPYNSVRKCITGGGGQAFSRHRKEESPLWKGFLTL